MSKRKYVEELVQTREVMNSRIRKLIADKERLEQEIAGTKRTAAQKRAALVAREAGVLPQVPVSWIAEQVEPNEDGSFDVERVREWATKHRLTREDKSERPTNVGSAPISNTSAGPSRKTLGKYQSEHDRERLTGGKFVPPKRERT